MTARKKGINNAGHKNVVYCHQSDDIVIFRNLVLCPEDESDLYHRTGFLFIRKFKSSYLFCRYYSIKVKTLDYLLNEIKK